MQISLQEKQKAVADGKAEEAKVPGPREVSRNQHDSLRGLDQASIFGFISCGPFQLCSRALALDTKYTRSAPTSADVLGRGQIDKGATSVCISVSAPPCLCRRTSLSPTEPCILVCSSPSAYIEHRRVETGNEHRVATR